MANYTIAVVGKGGSGKSIISSLIIRNLVLNKKIKTKLLVIDADPALHHLSTLLDVKVNKTLEDVRLKIIKVAAQKDENIKEKLVYDINYHLLEALIETKDFSLLVMGQPRIAGCFCPANTLLKLAIEAISESFDVIIIDCEAGLEQITRSVIQNIDTLIMITDPTIRGLKTVDAIRSTADKFTKKKTNNIIVINRVKNKIQNIIETAKTWNLEPIYIVPEDISITNLDLLGKPINNIDVNAPSVVAVRKILESINL